MKALKTQPFCDFVLAFTKKMNTDFKVIKTNEKILNLNLCQRGKAIRLSGHHHRRFSLKFKRKEV